MFPQTSSMDTTITTTSVPVPTGAQPESAASSTEHHNHAGAIVGGVIGGLALLVTVIGVYLVYRSRVRGIPARLRRRRPSAFGSSTVKKWDGSGSHDYAHGSSLPAYSDYGAAYKTSNPPSRHPSTGSGAYMLSGHTNSIGHSYYEDEKTPPTSSHGHEPLEPMPYTHYAFDIPPSTVPAAPTTAAFLPGRPRERSVTQDRASALATLSGPTSPISSPTSPYDYAHAYNRQSLDGRVLASPPMSPTAATAFQQGESVEMKRRSSSTRRMQRKAVPKYDEREFGADGAGSASVSRAASTSAPAASAPARRTPTPPAVEEARAAAAVGGGSRGSSSENLHDGSTTLHEHEHEADARLSRTRDELLAAGYQIPRLTEKASWGDMRSVHYLIPDMPAPQRD